MILFVCATVIKRISEIYTATSKCFAQFRILKFNISCPNKFLPHQSISAQVPSTNQWSSCYAKSVQLLVQQVFELQNFFVRQLLSSYQQRQRFCSLNKKILSFKLNSVSHYSPLQGATELDIFPLVQIIRLNYSLTRVFRKPFLFSLLPFEIIEVKMCKHKTCNAKTQIVI